MNVLTWRVSLTASSWHMHTLQTHPPCKLKPEKKSLCLFDMHNISQLPSATQPQENILIYRCAEFAYNLKVLIGLQRPMNGLLQGLD